MRFFQRGEVADSKFVFLDSKTLEPIDVINAVYYIVHYNGPNEIVDVATTALTKVTGQTGHYIANWTIPGTAPENETYFVYASGRHPTDNTLTTLEDFYRVLSASFLTEAGAAEDV